MVQEYKNIAVVGAGASGCICTYFLLKSGYDVALFDYGLLLRTLLPTGGGRCNLAHAEYDFRELTKNYPRGEKFLYSVFSKFSTYDTISLFNELGVETYTQEDGRIFPKSNSAKKVREAILKKITKANFIKEKVLKIVPNGDNYTLITNKAEYLFTHIVIASGGGNCIDGINHKVVPYTPSLVGLNSDINNLSGVVVKKVFSKDYKIEGDLLFTHFGVSGPLIYKISSLKTKEEFPYILNFDLCSELENLQKELNLYPHKCFKNIMSDYMPERLAKYILGEFSDVKAHKVDGKIRNLILDKVHNFKITITGTNKGEQTVTAGGYDLDEINSKSMESKIHPHIYFSGEVLNIDGFCGGFNLQNAWSTAYVASKSIIDS